MTAIPFEEVVRRHGPSVLRVCQGLVGGDDADDAWSETFLAALRAYPGLDQGSDPQERVRAWLLTIAHRKCVDLLRARGRRAAPVAEPPEPDRDRDRLVGASPDVAGEDAWVWTQVAALPTKQRHCLAYRYLGGLGFPDIAALVGGTPEAARRAASDGLRTLRARLAATAPATPAPSSTPIPPTAQGDHDAGIPAR